MTNVEPYVKLSRNVNAYNAHQFILRDLWPSGGRHVVKGLVDFTEVNGLGHFRTFDNAVGTEVGNAIPEGNDIAGITPTYKLFIYIL
jgi:hypothetical protein